MQITPRFHPHMLLKSLIILGGYFTCYYLAFFWSSSFFLSLVFAMGMGFFAAEVGVSIQHDGNHGKLKFFKGENSLINNRTCVSTLSLVVVCYICSKTCLEIYTRS